MEKKTKEFMEHILKTGCDLLFKSESLVPTFFVVTGDETLIVAAPWRDSKEKRVYCSVVQKLLAEKKADCVALISEIWISNDPTAPSPSEAEDRQDGLMVMHMEKDGTTNVIMTKVHMSPDGHPYTKPNEWKILEKADTHMLERWDIPEYKKGNGQTGNA